MFISSCQELVRGHGIRQEVDKRRKAQKPGFGIQAFVRKNLFFGDNLRSHSFLETCS